MINLSRATDTPSTLTAVPAAPMSPPPLLREQYLVQRPTAIHNSVAAAAGLGASTSSYFAPGTDGQAPNIVISMSVCLSVCWHNSKTTRLYFTAFLCTLPVAVTLSSSGGTAVSHVLPVLWMISYFHTTAIWCVTCIPISAENVTALTTAIMPTKVCSRTNIGNYTS